MSHSFNRRKFISRLSLATAGLSIPAFGAASAIAPSPADTPFQHTSRLPIPAGGRIGIIGLDTSHSTEFVNALNGLYPSTNLEGYRVVAAYPFGSKEIKSSADRIPLYTDYVRRFDVEIVDSIQALLERVDVVMLETNDGRPHLEQALQVMKAGKRLFIDKPVASSLEEVVAVYDTARTFKVPVFSSSSLRYNAGVQETASGKKVGKILGADTFSPAPLEPTHPDFFWYGIHGVEMLYALMGTGCLEVSRIYSPKTDLVTGTWKDGRIGSFRGTRSGKNEYGATVFGESGIERIGPYSGYDALLKEIISFFKTGISPVPEEETLEIYAFMEAAHESRRKGGLPVRPDAMLDKARKAMVRKW
ncbi:MAG: Gfo/Idh/MocA family oxidoreductase [Flavipsychrobacter sp.]|jgi:hypothetical protein|nr:Gfo/Idh/MocA family oxidoreductase [Flavipsychrobacter sp.]